MLKPNDPFTSRRVELVETGLRDDHGVAGLGENFLAQGEGHGLVIHDQIQREALSGGRFVTGLVLNSAASADGAIMRADSIRQSAAELSVRFWGVRGSIPSPGPETLGYGGNTSCVELRLGSEVLILDAGSGLRPLGLALSRELQIKSLDLHLLISHTHWDHIQGLPFFRPAYLPSNRIRILGAAGTRARLQNALVGQMDPLQFPVPFEALAGISGIEEFGAPRRHLGTFICARLPLIIPAVALDFA